MRPRLPRVPAQCWVAYSSTETGTHEVYLRPFPPSGEKIRVSPGGGLQPYWRQDGRELYYLTPDRMLMAVAVRTAATHLEFGTPVPLFRAPVADPGWGSDHYQPAADGRRFLINVLDPTQSAGSPDVVIVLDWARAMIRGAWQDRRKPEVGVEHGYVPKPSERWRACPELNRGPSAYTPAHRLIPGHFAGMLRLWPFVWPRQYP